MRAAHSMVPAATLRVREVINLRSHGKKRIRVWWANWEGKPREKTWEKVADVPQEFIDAYLEKQRKPAPSKKRKREREPVTRVAHSVTVAGGASPELQAQRRDDADWLEEEVARGGAAALKRQRRATNKTPRLIYEGGCSSSCSEALYVALRDRYVALAAVHVPDEPEIERVVTDIVPKQGAAGGTRITDEFRILNDKMVDEMLKPHAATGALHMPEKILGCTLSPPLVLQFETQRGVAKPPRRLRAYAHVSTIETVGGQVAVSTPSMPKDVAAAWAAAHRTAIARGLSCMPRSEVSPAMVRWLESPVGEEAMRGL